MELTFLPFNDGPCAVAVGVISFRAGKLRTTVPPVLYQVSSFSYKGARSTSAFDVQRLYFL